MIDLVELTIEPAQAGFTAGTLTAEALTIACLEQIPAGTRRTAR